MAANSKDSTAPAAGASTAPQGNSTSPTDAGGAPRSRDSFSRDSYSARGPQGAAADRPKAGAMEVVVDHNIEKAMKILKRKLIKEGLFKELKSRRYYEKPSERRKRKMKESLKKMRKEEARARRNSQLIS